MIHLNEFKCYFCLYKQFLIGLKQNLREEDNLSTRDKWSVPKVSSVRRFYCSFFSLSCVRMSIHVTIVLTVSDITCAMNMYWTMFYYAYCRLSQPYMCETTDYTAYAILKLCKRSRNVLYILFCAVNFSLNKKWRGTDTVFSYAELLRNTPPSL